MKLGIMQPYFLPYIGYFQLIAAVDKFVVYDNIQYTKKGWINRNRFLRNGEAVTFTLPLRKASDSLAVVERELATEWDRTKLLNQFRGAYLRAPQFDQVYPLLETIVQCEEANLFRYIHYSVVQLCKYFGIKTDIRISSEIDISHELKGQDKVLALCEAVGASTYVNTVGGVELYSKEDFHANGIVLQFIKSQPFVYDQFGSVFTPWLSIVDVLMFNSLDTVRSFITRNYLLD